MKRRPAWLSIAATLMALARVPVASVAAPPPTGYPSATIVRTVFNKKLALSIPPRRGFYDANADAGFGWDKLWNKHNLWDHPSAKSHIGHDLRKAGRDSATHPERWPVCNS